MQNKFSGNLMNNPIHFADSAKATDRARSYRQILSGLSCLYIYDWRNRDDPKVASASPKSLIQGMQVFQVFSSWRSVCSADRTASSLSQAHPSR